MTADQKTDTGVKAGRARAERGALTALREEWESSRRGRFLFAVDMNDPVHAVVMITLGALVAAGLLETARFMVGGLASLLG